MLKYILLILLMVCFLGLSIWLLIEENVWGWVSLVVYVSLTMYTIYLLKNEYTNNGDKKVLSELELEFPVSKPVRTKESIWYVQEDPMPYVEQAERMERSIGDWLRTHSATATDDIARVQLLEMERKLRTMIAEINYLDAQSTLLVTLRKYLQDVEKRLLNIRRERSTTNVRSGSNSCSRSRSQRSLDSYDLRPSLKYLKPFV